MAARWSQDEDSLTSSKIDVSPQTPSHREKIRSLGGVHPISNHKISVCSSVLLPLNQSGALPQVTPQWRGAVESVFSRAVSGQDTFGAAGSGAFLDK